MGKTRNTVTYSLKRGQRVVYKGITNEPERREKQHRKEGKRFDRLEVTSRRMTEDGAKKKEGEQLAQYRRGHRGRNPQYNSDDDG